MACNTGGTNRNGLLNQLKDLVTQIDDGKCPKSPDGGIACVPCERPFAQVCFTCPPCIPLPTSPAPVKPLQMPRVPRRPTTEELIAAERAAFRSRYDNFYNNYNVDYRQEQLIHRGPSMQCPPPQNVATVDGKLPDCCSDTMRERNGGQQPCCDSGCPTGFKPCTMKLEPPLCCNPIGVWKAEIQPCPPKPKQKACLNIPTPEECKRPCCKHWKPKGNPCVYGRPCKADCYDHPIGMKAN